MGKERKELILHLASFLEFSKNVSKVGVDLSNKQIRMIIQALVKEVNQNVKL